MIQFTVRTTVSQLDNVYDNIFTLRIVSVCLYVCLFVLSHVSTRRSAIAEKAPCIRVRDCVQERVRAVVCMGFGVRPDSGVRSII